MEALKERGILLRNAPHIVKDLKFIVPNYSWWEAPFYGIGMKIYDFLRRGSTALARRRCSLWRRRCNIFRLFVRMACVAE